MIYAWYEKIRDQKDCLYFALHEGKGYGSRGTPFPGFHNSIEFAFGIEGSMEIVISGKSHFLNPGEVCFMNSREPHKYHYNNDVKCYIVLISNSFFTDVNRLGEISFASHSEKCEHFDIVKSYLDYAIKHWDDESLLCKRAFADTFAFLMTRYYPSFPKKDMEKQSAALLDSVKYICEHYSERLTVSSVAKVYGYSANYFSSAFNEFMGSSFPDFVNTCRLIEFYKLREQCPELSVSRMAAMCGFGSMKTFYRAVEKVSQSDSVMYPLQKIINRI